MGAQTSSKDISDPKKPFQKIPCPMEQLTPPSQEGREEFRNPGYSKIKQIITVQDIQE